MIVLKTYEELVNLYGKDLQKILEGELNQICDPKKGFRYIGYKKVTNSAKVEVKDIKLDAHELQIKASEVLIQLSGAISPTKTRFIYKGNGLGYLFMYYR